MTKILSHNFSIKNIDENGTFAGYANVFNVLDQNNDIVLPGSFGKIDPKKIKLLWQHDTTKPVGKVLDIKEDKNGLYVKCLLLLEIQQAKEIYELIKSNIIDGLSIGYIPLKYSTQKNGVRLIKSIQIFEISLVTFPANNESRIQFVKNNQSIHPNAESIIFSINNAISILKNNKY